MQRVCVCVEFSSHSLVTKASRQDDDEKVWEFFVFSAFHFICYGFLLKLHAKLADWLAIELQLPLICPFSYLVLVAVWYTTPHTHIHSYKLELIFNNSFSFAYHYCLKVAPVHSFSLIAKFLNSLVFARTFLLFQYLIDLSTLNWGQFKWILLFFVFFVCTNSFFKRNFFKKIFLFFQQSLLLILLFL